MRDAQKQPRRLHIGGRERRDGWEIFDAVPADGVDHTGNAIDLARFQDGTFTELYASHVLEHFDFKGELPAVLREWHRVLQPGGTVYISVPDLERLCHLYLTPRLAPDARQKIMYMIFGAHFDAYDYHKAGIDEAFLRGLLQEAGFTDIRRVTWFDLFQDTSTMQYLGMPISLNMLATR